MKDNNMIAAAPELLAEIRRLRDSGEVMASLISRIYTGDDRTAGNLFREAWDAVRRWESIAGGDAGPAISTPGDEGFINDLIIVMATHGRCLIPTGDEAFRITRYDEQFVELLRDAIRPGREP